MIAKELITGSVPCLTLTDQVISAIREMQQTSLKHLPVVREDTYLGLVSLKDCQDIIDPQQTIGEANVHLNPVAVFEADHIFAALAEFSESGSDLLPVTGNERDLTGVILANQLPAIVSSFLSASTPGGVIVLEINEKDYDLAELAQIVQSNDAKILSLFACTPADPSLIEVTLKVNRMEIGAILQSFFRFNYRVKYSWSSQDAYHEQLHDRFDALMNYLSI